MNTSKLTFRIDQHVRWGELDALNHVNNATYFSYFEDIRIAYMTHVGYGSVSSNDEFGPVLANIRCEFKSPLTFPDQLSIGCGITKIGKSSFELVYDIYSEQQQKIVATGASVAVMVDYARGTSVPIPDAIRNKFEESTIEL